MQAAQVSQQAAQMTASNRRKKYVINPAFQWKQGLTLATFVFILTSMLSCILYAVLHEQARQRILHPMTYSVDVGMMILLAAFAYSVVTAGGIGLWCVFTSHRVCGPLFVLDRHFRQLASGRMPSLRPLRRKDEFKDLFADFALAVEKIKADRREEIRALDQLFVQLDSLEEHDQQTAQQTVYALRQQIDELRTTLSTSLGTEFTEETETDNHDDENDGMSETAPRSKPSIPVGVS